MIKKKNVPLDLMSILVIKKLSMFFFKLQLGFTFQSIKAQCIGAYNRLPAPISTAPCNSGLYAELPLAPLSPCGAGWASTQAGLYGLGASNAAALVASNGGGLPTSSSSPLAPNGLSVISENAIEGSLAVSGALPFLGTVALEGILPTAGSGGVTYGCGNGNVGIISEDISAAGSGYGVAALEYGAGALGYGVGGLGWSACGCGAY